MGEAVEPAAAGMESGLSIGEAEVLVGAAVDPSGDGDESEEPEGIAGCGCADELQGAGGEGQSEQKDGESGFSVGATDGAGGDLGPIPGEVLEFGGQFGEQFGEVASFGQGDEDIASAFLFFLIIGSLGGCIGADTGEFKGTSDQGFFNDEQLDAVAWEAAGAAGEESISTEEVIAAAFQGEVMEEDDGAGDGEGGTGEAKDEEQEEDGFPLELVVLAEPLFGLGAEAGEPFLDFGLRYQVVGETDGGTDEDEEGGGAVGGESFEDEFTPAELDQGGFREFGLWGCRSLVVGVGEDSQAEAGGGFAGEGGEFSFDTVSAGGFDLDIDDAEDAVEGAGFESEVLDPVEGDIAFVSGEESLTSDEFTIFDAVGESEVADEVVEEAEAEDGEEYRDDTGAAGGDDKYGRDEESAEDAGSIDEESEGVQALFCGGCGWG
jgi:hypothetical protein